MLIPLLCALALAAPADDVKFQKRVDRILGRTPLIDGHNDVPWAYRSRANRRLGALPFDRDTTDIERPMHTDLPRLREGQLGGVFWSVWIPTELEGPEAVVTVLEQIDVVHRMVERWPDDLELALTARDVRRIHKEGRIASLIGMEGGHSIGGNLAVLRATYAAGARYMTLTHWETLPWADAATDAPKSDGLSPFGEEVVREMNRIGMLVDLSHVAATTMHDALDVAEAPVIFSHSGAYAINPHPRNVPDDVLDRVKENGGVVMVDFLPMYVSKDVHHWHADQRAERAKLESMNLGDPEAVEAKVATWTEAHPAPMADLATVADHVEHIAKRIGIEHVGIGTDFDGMRSAPTGLEDVSAIPNLLVELAKRGYTDDELAGVAGENVLRVMERAEAAAVQLKQARGASEADLEEK